MAVNKPVGDNARKGAVRKRPQLETKIMGEKHWSKRNKENPVSSWIRRMSAISAHWTERAD